MKKLLAFLFLSLLSGQSFAFIGAISHLLSNYLDKNVPQGVQNFLEPILIFIGFILYLVGFLFFLYYAYVSLVGMLDKTEKISSRIAYCIRLFACLGIVLLMQWIIVSSVKDFF
jgi:hypothetical protein